MQLPVHGQQLQIERAFVLCDAANRLAIAQPHGYRLVRRRAASSARSTAGRWCRTGIFQRLLDLRRRTIAPDIRKVRTEHTAASTDHVTTRAVPLTGEKSFARRRVAQPGCAGRDGAACRLLQDHNVRGDGDGFLFGNPKGGHASVANALEDQLSYRFEGCGAGPNIHDVGAMPPAGSILSVAAHTARLVLPLPGVHCLAAGVIHQELNTDREKDDTHLSSTASSVSLSDEPDWWLIAFLGIRRCERLVASGR